MLKHCIATTAFLLLLVSGPRADTLVDAEQAAATIQQINDDFLRTGELNPNLRDYHALSLERSVAAAAPGQRHALLLELAALNRLYSRSAETVAALEAAIADAPDGSESLVKAWGELAREHAEAGDQTKADEALERAIIANADALDPQRRFWIARARSILAELRDDDEAALVDALDARRFAQKDRERFLAEFHILSALRDIILICQHRPLIDAKAKDDRDDHWGACRRGIQLVERQRQAAQERAAALGYNYFASFLASNSVENSVHAAMLDKFDSTLADADFFGGHDAQLPWRLDLVPPDGLGSSPEDASHTAAMRDILEANEAEVSDLLIELSTAALTAEASLLVAEGRPDEALKILEVVFANVEGKSRSQLDPRFQNLAREDAISSLSLAGLLYLQLGQRDRAFAVFEGARASGLNSLGAVVATQEEDTGFRRWLGGLVEHDARISDRIRAVFEDTIAGDDEHLLADLDMLEDLRRQRAEHFAAADAKRFEALSLQVDVQQPSLAELAEAVRKSGIPVLTYWTTDTFTLVWAITPTGIETRTVFLPDYIAAHKVESVLSSAACETCAFDKETAQQLYTYLISPFERHLNVAEVMIVPQGPLVGLPFEILVDPKSGGYLADRIAISYAPMSSLH